MEVRKEKHLFQAAEQNKQPLTVRWGKLKNASLDALLFICQCVLRSSVSVGDKWVFTEPQSPAVNCGA